MIIFTSLMLPFFEVLLQTWREVLKMKEEKVKNAEMKKNVVSVLKNTYVDHCLVYRLN